jgi:hypothetical protein
MLRHLARNGIVKPPATAPFEFLALVRTRWAGAQLLAGTITDLYCRGRFSARELTNEELQLARQSLDELLQLHRTG